jgi:hypothetical protein
MISDSSLILVPSASVMVTTVPVRGSCVPLSRRLGVLCVMRRISLLHRRGLPWPRIGEFAATRPLGHG